MFKEIITINGWVDGGGWSYTQVYSTRLVEEMPESLEVGDVWEADEKQDGGDTQIVVTYYAADDEDNENELKEFKFWESDLFDGEDDED